MSVGYRWQQVIDAIGEYDADRLVARFGGDTVGLNTKPNTQVYRIIGGENVQKLLAIYPDHQMKVPLGKLSADEQIRMKYISLRIDEGMGVSKARRVCGRSESWARGMEKKMQQKEIVSNKPHHNQLDMMDYLDKSNDTS